MTPLGRRLHAPVGRLLHLGTHLYLASAIILVVVLIVWWSSRRRR